MTGDEPAPADRTARVLTLNIYHDSADWPARRAVIASGLHDVQPDLIAFQETVTREGFDQVRDLVGDTWHVAHSRVRSATGVGVSIAGRWPFEAVDELDLHVAKRGVDYPPTALVAAVSAPSPFGGVIFVNHFPEAASDLEIDREQQALLVARHVEQIADVDERHVILAGDMNAEPDSTSLRFLAGKQSLDGESVCYRDVWDRAHPAARAHTYECRNPLMAAANDGWPFSQIDHIFVRCSRNGWPTLDVVRCELAFARPIDGIWASDHAGLVADFSVNTAPVDGP